MLSPYCWCPASAHYVRCSAPHPKAPFKHVHVSIFAAKVEFMFLLVGANLLQNSNGVKENVIRRLETIENCKIRGLGKDVNGIEATFMLALCGERRGRLLDERDLRKLEVANRLCNNKYAWVVESAGRGGGLAVQEMELQNGFLNQPHASETLVSVSLQLWVKLEDDDSICTFAPIFQLCFWLSAMAGMN
jgi:hypothetical protein